MTTRTPPMTTKKGSPPEPAPKEKPLGATVSLLLTRVGPRLLLLVVLVASTWLAFAQFSTPAVVPKTAPASEFSAARAMTELSAIAKEPHPMGSPANAAVQAYLIRQIRALGLTPEVQTTTVTTRVPGSNELLSGTVHNVIVRLKGTANTHAILLDAHYDSVASAPGATDCGSCVVTALETMRALVAGPPLKNDVIFVFSDGEERWGLGARAFATQHPWMQEVGLALTFEGAGTGGPTQLWETSRQNGWLITEFLKAAPFPLANSFTENMTSGLVNSHMDDLFEYMDRGSAGLGFIYLGGEPAGYHSMLDNVQTIDAGSIQHDGSYALSLVRHFGSMDLSQVPRAPDEVFFNLLPGVVVHYSSTWAVPLAVLAVLLLLGVLALGFRRKRLTAGGFALGVLVFLLSLVGTLILLALAWMALKAVNPNYQVTLYGGYYSTGLLQLGLAVLVIAAMSALFLWLRRRMRTDNLAAGALTGWAIVLVLLSLFFPGGFLGGSYLFTWPLLASALALGGLFLLKEPAAHPWLRAAILSVAMVPAVVVLLPPLLLFLAPFMGAPGAGLPVPPTLPVVFAALLMGLFIPQLALLSGEPHAKATPAANPTERPRGSSASESRPALRADRRVSTHLSYWLVPVVALLIGVVLSTSAIGTSGFSAAHPGTDSITYQLNADTGQALWLSSDQHLDDWTRQFFPTSTGQGPFQAHAPVVALAAPTVTLKSDSMSGGVRTLRVQVASPRHAENAIVKVEAQGEIVAATLDGQPFDLRAFSQSARHQLQFSYYGLPDRGFELTLSVRSAAPVKITVQDLTSGLPTIAGMTIRPRPADLMPAPQGFGPSDPTIVLKSFTFAR
jgi:hypothetical protein